MVLKSRKSKLPGDSSKWAWGWNTIDVGSCWNSCMFFCLSPRAYDFCVLAKGMRLQKRKKAKTFLLKCENTKKNEHRFLMFSKQSLHLHTKNSFLATPSSLINTSFSYPSVETVFFFEKWVFLATATAHSFWKEFFFHIEPLSSRHRWRPFS